ncbi:MAG: hypothetical protein NVS4B3_02950 [Gemmatimonadaceae bacterium]
MKRPFLLALPIITSLAFLGPSASRAQEAKVSPTASTASASAPTAFDVARIADEKELWAAFAKKDAVPFDRLMTRPALIVDATGINDGSPDAIRKMIAACELKTYDLTGFQVLRPRPDVAIVTYTATMDETCDGQKAPSKVYASSTWVLRRGVWRSPFHQESGAM